MRYGQIDRDRKMEKPKDRKIENGEEAERYRETDGDSDGETKMNIWRRKKEQYFAG